MAGLFQLTQELREGKFPVLLRRDGTRPAWPYFVLGARDLAAPTAIREYAEACRKLQMDPQYIRDLHVLADIFIAYRQEHGEGDPDAPRHRRDDPAVLAFPASLAEHDAEVRREEREAIVRWLRAPWADPEDAAEKVPIGESFCVAADCIERGDHNAKERR